METVRDLIDRAAEKNGYREFLISPETGRSVSFKGLQQALRHLCARFQKMGLERGDKVALLMDNGLFTLQLFLGAMYGGLVSVPLNVRAGTSHLSYMLEHCDAKVVFVSDKYEALFKEAASKISRPFEVVVANIDYDLDDDEGSPPTKSLMPISGNDAALLMYSSGTTGVPNGAVHTHKSLIAHGRNAAQSHQLTSDDRSLLILPIYHINAECVTLLPTLSSGGSIVVPHGFVVSEFWDWLDHNHCTWSALVPTIVSQLLDWKDPESENRAGVFQRIRFLRTSSGPLSPSLHREFLAKFKLLLIQAMGCSEGGNVFSNPLPPGKNKIGSPGFPWGFEAKIINREGADVPEGEPGEVLLRGDGLMQGYYKDPAGTAAAFDSEGWFHTGDLAYRDQDGYFFVVGRSKELVIKGGMNIAPKQIDEALESHRAVLEAAAVGVPDRYLGEDLVAFVVLRDGMTCSEGELLNFCDERLGHFKTPTRIHFVSDLPKGPSGKVQRLRLVTEGQRLATANSVLSTDVLTGLSTGRPSSRLAVTNTSLEQAIGEIWSNLLSEPEIDPSSNFFALGGQSLVAIQYLSRLRDKVQAILSLSDFFENPTIKQQAELIRKRLAESAGEPAVATTQTELQSVSPRDRNAPCRLSPAQDRLWFLEQLISGEPAYNESEAVRLKGDLNIDVLERALNFMIERREILRSTIEVRDGQPQAVVHDKWPIKVNRIDLSVLPVDQREQKLARLLVDEPRRRYRLEAEPGIRSTVIKVAEDEHAFILMMHHIICDSSSLGILWREVASAYQAYLEDKSPSLPPLPIQYWDYASWQRLPSRQAAFDTDLSFWREKLRDAPEVLDLPMDRPRLPVNSYRGEKRQFSFDSELATKLRGLSRQEQASLFTVFAAGLNVLFYRYTAKDDILVGIPIADRDRPEVQSLIGFMIDTHVLRTDLSGDPSFRELMARVQRDVAEVYSHRSVPFDQVVDALRPRRSLSYSPLFQVMLNWRDRDEQPQFIEFAGLTIEPLLSHSNTSKFDITLTITDAGDRILLEAEYSTELFDLTRVERMIEHLRTVLEGATTNPEQRLGNLPLLTSAERRQLVGWNQTQKDYPRNKCLHELFEEQAERTPEAVAVIFENEHLTYRQLNERTNQLAHYLKSLGVGPETMVGICVERSFEMVVGLLGILKSGGAYVPLDPEYPKERLAFMLEDAAVPVLLTQEHLSKSLPSHESRIVRLDSDWSLIAKESVVHVKNAGRAEDLAYMIYTSGSTGRPKGVMNTHVAIVNQLLWMQDAYRLTPLDRVLQKTPFSFDVSLCEFFWPLLTGATLVVALPGGHKDGAYLANLVRRERITTIHFVPSMLSAFLEQEGLESSCASLKRVICSGEAVAFELQQRFFSLLPAELHNLYGPTEAAVHVTYWACERESCLRTVPIGRPIANTQIHILDRHLQPTPIGVPGELHIGGVGLARGYHKRAELTAEKFISDPFRRESGARLYKTGDLACHLPNGAIEYLGRLDYQVKVRGFRIELGEIEAVLAELPEVREAAVVALEDASGGKRLVAYLTSRGEEAPSQSELRRQLQAKLPDYMLPSVFVLLDRFPLSASGKLDRRALPAPELTSTGLRRAPSSPTEEILCSLFATTLKLKEVGASDNFFELGGHSLLAAQLISRIRNTLNVEVAIRTVFEAPTVEGIAKRLEGADIARPALMPQRRPSEIPLSFAQRRLWFLERFAGRSATYTIPIAMRLSGVLDHTALQAAFGDLVARHEALRTIFPDTNGVPHQVILEVDAARPRLLVETTSAEALSGALTKAAKRGFDLATEIPLRAHLFALSDNEHVLLLLLHHIAADGWSVAPLWRDLAATYAAHRDGKATVLPTLPVQYADYTLWQQHVLGREADPQSTIARELGFWKTRLKDLPTEIKLPSDRVRPPIASYRGDQVRLHLGTDLHRGLVRLARETEASLFMVLQAALATLLTRLGAGTDIPIGSPIAGRTDNALDELVGFFVNTLVLRTDTSGDPKFYELIERVRSTNLAAYDHQDLPFEGLVEVLNPERSMSRHPLFQVMLVLQNNAPLSFELPGLITKAEPVATATAKFDLSFSLVERRAADGSPAGIDGVIEYATDLFDAARIERMAGHLCSLLEDVVLNPERRLHELKLLTNAERCRLVEEWNSTAVGFPNAQHIIHELFEEQVERTPDAPAVIFGSKQLTYRQLNRCADEVAIRLRGLGVAPGVLVALFLERSLEMPVGMLGVLKAGGAYVPLDPAHPRNRLAYMLEDAKPLVLLTHKSLVSELPPHHSQLVIIDAASLPAKRFDPLETAVRACSPRDLAYVIYTSGSTGEPKGVEIEHHAVVNMLLSMQRRPGLGADDAMLAITTLTFDIAVLEILLPLVSGARVVIAGSRDVRDADALTRLLARHSITAIQATPATMRMLLNAGWRGAPGLKVLCGGEAWPAELASDLLARCESLWNMYGPTETTVWSAVGRVEFGGPVVIGSPIANTQLFVLDQDLQLVPIGVPGELHIGGTGLARGYHNRPQLTAEKFISDPFLTAPEARLYKTGDLVQRLENGSIEYLGRMDNQVKVRGFRIELGEIESVLQELPAVRQAVVVAREMSEGDKRLIAYMVSHGGTTPRESELRRLLQARLPEFMIPSIFVEMDQFPLTPNGKVDRKALPDPQKKVVDTEDSYVAPRTKTELALSCTWCECLNLERVGIHDNFFDRGGYSLLAVRVVGQINKALNTRVNVPTFFQNPTIERLGQIIDQHEHLGSERQLIRLQHGHKGLPMYFIGSGLVETRIANLIGNDRGIFAIDSSIPVKWRQAITARDPSALPTVEELGARYGRLVYEHAGSSPCIIIGSNFGGVLAFETARALQRDGGNVELVLLIDAFARGGGVTREPLRQGLATILRAPSQRAGSELLSHRLFRLTVASSRLLLWSLKRMPAVAKTRLVRSPNKAPSNLLDTEGVPLDRGVMLELYRILAKGYHPRPLDAPGVLVRAEVPDEDLLPSPDRTNGWGSLFRQGLEVIQATGGHITMVDDRNGPALGSRINVVLDRYRSKAECEDSGTDSTDHQEQLIGANHRTLHRDSSLLAAK